MKYLFRTFMILLALSVLGLLITTGCQKEEVQESVSVQATLTPEPPKEKESRFEITEIPEEDGEQPSTSTITIKGTIQDSDEKPVSNATVG